MQQKNFSDGYKKALINCEANIKKIGLKTLNIEDLFFEVVRNATGGIKEIFNLYGINDKLALEIINKGVFNEHPEKRKGIYHGMQAKLKDIILGSVKIAAGASKEKATIEDLLLSMLLNDTWLSDFLAYVGINPSDIEINLNDLQKIGTIDGESTGNKSSNGIPNELGQIISNIFGSVANISTTPFDGNKKQEKEKETSTTPALDYFSNNLNKEAEDGKIDKIIGRDLEIERLIAVLNRKTKNNPVLIGEPGVGKTAIVEGLAKRITDGNVPFSMKDKRILSLDMSSLIAGTKYRGEFELRIKQVIDEASKVENEIILFIDEIHTIIGAGNGEGSLDASNILKPAMGRGKIRVIGATTLNEYQKYIEKDSALDRRFQKVNSPEPDNKTAIEILEGLKDSFEEYHNLLISDEACVEAVELSTRYINDKYLPDKAIDLIDEACSLKSMKYNFDEKETKKLREKISVLIKKAEGAVMNQEYKKASGYKKQQLEVEKKIYEIKSKFSIPKEKRLKVGIYDIQKVLSMSTGIPTENLSGDEIKKIRGLKNTIKGYIIGQDEAIDSITKSITKSKAGIGNKNRPLGSFLFLGPTGVGKTELVKVLANEFYDDKDALIKIDMSEYSDKTSVNKLIGSSAGYVGYEEGGLLTERVRKKPYSVILFDEIEKGDFEVYNLLLQILEEGSITDNKGRVINFRNTIIIMTSNIGQEEFSKKAEMIGFDISDKKEEKIMEDYTKAKENVISNLPEYFSPEFINRIDKIVVFNPLDKKNIRKIVKLSLDDFEKRLNKKDLNLKYDNKILGYITKEVYNPEFGAREIRRYINDNIEDLIAEKIIANSKKKDYEIILEKSVLKIK